MDDVTVFPHQRWQLHDDVLRKMGPRTKRDSQTLLGRGGQIKKGCSEREREREKSSLQVHADG